MLNTLFLKRLLILKESKGVAYDEKFHKGVNIIRGANSSGKSTISHFIFYALGGSFNRWTDEAKLCEEVYAEIELNGINMTLKRFISESGNQPMYIFLGDIEDALAIKSAGHWKKFPYSSTNDKISFSNYLFETLNIPIVYGDNNITMHQILRLLYIDQDSPTSSFFLYEQFDSGLTRQTIADLLLGVYDSSLYIDRIDKRDSEKKINEVESDIRTMRKLYDDLRLLDVNHVKNLIENNQVDIKLINDEILELREDKKRVNFGKKSKLSFQKLNNDNIIQRKKNLELSNHIDKLEHEISDSIFFIETLEQKKVALERSILTRDYFKSFPFRYCPECLSELEVPDENHCKLCKQEIDDKQSSIITKRMLQEILFQIKESKKLLDIRKNALRDRVSEYESNNILLSDLQKQVNVAMKDVKSFKSEKIDQLLISKGELEGMMIQYANTLEIAERYEIYLKEKASLKITIDKLTDSISTKEYKQKKLGKKIKLSIEEYALDLLKSDLNREVGFKEATSLDINFYDNSIYVDDKKKKFSASSEFYLKNTARFSLFFSSLGIERMRFPRFILSDNMEDKGIEKERAQNFQRLIIKKANESKNQDYQIIYTTSFIPEELEGSNYCVGDFYSEETGKKSLDV